MSTEPENIKVELSRDETSLILKCLRNILSICNDAETPNKTVRKIDGLTLKIVNAINKLDTHCD